MIGLPIGRSIASRSIGNALSHANRSLSSQSADAVHKLRAVLEEYRLEHYSQELPTRFKKDILKEASYDGLVGVGGMQRVLANIGAEKRISSKEINTIFHEYGNGAGQIAASQFSSML